MSTAPIANQTGDQTPTLSRRQRLLVHLGLIAFGIAVGLIGVEIGLRIINQAPKGSQFKDLAELRSSILTADNAKDAKGSATLGSIINPHPDDEIIYDLRPNISVTFQGQPVTTNSCGMRDREFSMAKPPNTYRIAMLGDSFTFGWGVRVEHSFPKVLEKNLNARAHGNRKVEVMNFGVPGYSTFQEVAQFEQVWSDFDPDAIIVFFIENDFGLPFYIQDIQNPGQLTNSVGLERLAQQALGQKEKPKPMQLPKNFDPNRALTSLADFASNRGIRLYLALNPKKTWKEMANRLWVLRSRRDIHFMNLRKPFVDAVKHQKIDQKALTIQGDGHPSPIKHQILADTMTPYFLDIVK